MTERIEITAGARVITDGRLAKGGTFEPLETCDYWDAAPFVFPGQNGTPSLAVRVEITGRTTRYDVARLAGTPVRRVRVVVVGDGEPDTVLGGWIIDAPPLAA